MRSAVQVCPGLPHGPDALLFFSALYQVNLGFKRNLGAIAQLGERLVCIQEVCGSIPHSSTIYGCEHVYLGLFIENFIERLLAGYFEEEKKRAVFIDRSSFRLV